jgi:hypothetical protein
MVVVIVIVVIFVVPAVVSWVAQRIARKGRNVVSVSWGGTTPNNAVRGTISGSDWFVR